MKQHRFLFAILFAILICEPCRAQFNEYAVPDMYLQYVPHAATLFLPVCGVKNVEHPWIWDRVIVVGWGIASSTLICNGLKLVIREERPDKSAMNSFPSGHTATAFSGAEIVRHEFGWGWGAGAYAVATSVAVLRVVHNRHFVWDTIAGAGIGILSANIGYWLLQPTKNLFRIKTPERMKVALAPSVDPYSGVICASLAVTF